MYLVTRSLTERVRIRSTWSVKTETFYGFSELGALKPTCNRTLSRIHQVGYQLAVGVSWALPKGKALAEIFTVSNETHKRSAEHYPSNWLCKFTNDLEAENRQGIFCY